MTRRRPAPAPAQPAVAGDPPAGRSIPGRVAPPPRPARNSGGDEPADVYYLDDGTEVRDHRDGQAREPSIWPGDVPHPSLSPVTPQVTSRVMALVRPVVLGCFKQVPDTGFAEDALVVTRAVVSIDEAGQLTVRELGAKSRGVDGGDPAALERAYACIRDGSSGLTTAVDNPAVEQTVLVFPIKPQQYRRQ